MNEIFELAKAWGPTGISGLIYLLARRVIAKIDEHETRLSRIEGVCEERGRSSEC